MAFIARIRRTTRSGILHIIAMLFQQRVEVEGERE